MPADVIATRRRERAIESGFEISYNFSALIFVCLLTRLAAKLVAAKSSPDQPESPVAKVASCFHDAFLACRIVQWLKQLSRGSLSGSCLQNHFGPCGVFPAQRWYPSVLPQ
jgi:hypothetical protein